jgi:hypothetical protein
LLDQLAGFPDSVTCAGNVADACWTGDTLDCP